MATAITIRTGVFNRAMVNIQETRYLVCARDELFGNIVDCLFHLFDNIYDVSLLANLHLCGYCEFVG